MINFKIYNMNNFELLSLKKTKEEAVVFANKENMYKRLMIVKHDDEKGDEIVNRTTGESYYKVKEKKL